MATWKFSHGSLPLSRDVVSYVFHMKNWDKLSFLHNYALVYFIKINENGNLKIVLRAITWNLHKTVLLTIYMVLYTRSL